MNGQLEKHNVTSKKKGIFRGVLIFITIYIIIMLISNYLGRQSGRRAAINNVHQESISQNAPTGFLGAKWLMSLSEVKFLFPDAVEFSKDNLKMENTAFDRPAYIDFVFNNNMLLIIVISFKGEKTESIYSITQIAIEKMYGSFPEPSKSSEHILSTEKEFGRIVIQHMLYQQNGLLNEQVMLYRTKF